MIRGEGSACISFTPVKVKNGLVFTLNALIHSVLRSVVKGEGKKF